MATTIRGKTIRNAEGERIIVTLDLSDRYGGTGTDHQPIRDYTRVSFTGDVYRKHARYPYSCGQVSDALPEDHPVRVEWERWHNNDLRSHCIHQDSSVRWDHCPACPETGYKAGHAWLVEPIPAEDIARILALFP